MKRRRGLSRKSVRCRGWNRRIFGMPWWKLAIVLIGFMLAVSCSEESAPEPQEETSSEVVAESAGEEEKLDAVPTTGQEETSEPSSAELATRESATTESVTTEPETTEPKTVKSATTERLTSAEIPGVAFTQKLKDLLDYELNGRSLGWRPNDLLVGRLTDNVNEFQLGTLEASRYTAKTLKESLARLSDADAFDPNLVEAVSLLMNRADKFWFPSSESQYEEALENLQEFLNNLRQGKSHFYYRTDNLQALVASYKDLLGNCHENLVKVQEPDGTRVSYFRADNYFYYCQGVAHVMHEILRTVRVGFVEQLQTIDAVALMDKIVEDLERASESDPWLITNGHDDGILANHRYNLAASISSALHNMSTMLRRGENARDRTVSLEEYLRLRAQAVPHIQAILAVAMSTGMRRGEILGLRWSYIDREKRMIRLPAELTKENKLKSIPISQPVWEVFSKQPRALHHDYVFTYKGEPIRNTIRMAMVGTCSRAGIPYGRDVEGGFIFHDLRRTVKTNMARAGIEKVYRDVILGHSLQGMDAYYLKPSDEDLHAAMEKYTSWLEAQLVSVGNEQEGERVREKMELGTPHLFSSNQDIVVCS